MKKNSKLINTGKIIRILNIVVIGLIFISILISIGWGLYANSHRKPDELFNGTAMILFINIIFGVFFMIQPFMNIVSTNQLIRYIKYGKDVHRAQNKLTRNAVGSGFLSFTYIVLGAFGFYFDGLLHNATGTNITIFASFHLIVLIIGSITLIASAFYMYKLSTFMPKKDKKSEKDIAEYE